MVKRNADGVEPRAVDQFNILLRNVLVAVFMPEFLRLFWSDEFIEIRLDLASGLWPVFETKHVAFIHQPIAEVDSAQQQWLARGIDKLFAIAMNIAALRLR